MVFQSHWLENPIGDYNKQDFERKAFIRLEVL